MKLELGRELQEVITEGWPHPSS